MKKLATALVARARCLRSRVVLPIPIRQLYYAAADTMAARLWRSGYGLLRATIVAPTTTGYGYNRGYGYAVTNRPFRRATMIVATTVAIKPTDAVCVAITRRPAVAATFPVTRQIDCRRRPRRAYPARPQRLLPDARARRRHPGTPSAHLPAPAWPSVPRTGTKMTL